MDNAQIEQELEELETRVERLRSLYEQYFLGLEKLEPQVQRKDVDRRFWVLRREQIRNTGLRFKFQMLVQRYNTYQQYWHRVVREIETGTYRRDILKVAKRFGEKEALTLLGKKRAAQYANLAKAQEERKKKRQDLLSEMSAEGDVEVTVQEDDAPVSLSSDDLIEDSMSPEDLEALSATAEREVDTPIQERKLPPVRQRPAPVAYDLSDEPDMEAMLAFATVGVKTWQKQADTAEAPKQGPSAEAPRQGPSIGAVNVPSPPRAPEPEEVPVPNKPKIAVAVPPKAAAGPAGKSRVAELAAEMRAKRRAESAEATQPALDLGLDDVLGGGAPNKAAQNKTAPTAAPNKESANKDSASKESVNNDSANKEPVGAAPTNKAPAAPAVRPSEAIGAEDPPSDTKTLPWRAPGTGARPGFAARPMGPVLPAPTARPNTGASLRPQPAIVPAAPATTAPKPAITATATPGLAARPAPAVSAAQAPREPAGEAKPQAAGTPSDQRMREVYAKYVDAKRAAQESTAGLTFDKLSQSLKAQAEKLKSAHPTKTVDFEVVNKDGKTAIRPVLK